jgi:hypothetical protein
VPGTQPAVLETVQVPDGTGQALVAALSVALPERLPAASNASTASEYVRPQERPPNVAVVAVVVPVATPSRERP